MKWPFKRDKIAALPTVELTDDERQEAEAMIRSLTRTEDGVYVVRVDQADSFNRSIVALSLLGRADRFLIMARSQAEFAEEACRTAAKACAVYPLSINFYEFACILQKLQRGEEAKAMFKEFLRRHESERPDPVQQIVLDSRDLAGAVRHARELVDRPLQTELAGLGQEMFEIAERDFPDSDFWRDDLPEVVWRKFQPKWRFYREAIIWRSLISRLEADPRYADVLRGYEGLILPSSPTPEGLAKVAELKSAMSDVDKMIQGGSEKAIGWVRAWFEDLGGPEALGNVSPIFTFGLAVPKFVVMIEKILKEADDLLSAPQ
ncbi:MAG TPA: hypothetical protein VNF45_06985 [Candidatus Binataceae bacterium]|nr:hypothetical protein [Candidatus Binataceae bacterium]